MGNLRLRYAYYIAKPFVPRPVQIALRRMLVRFKLRNGHFSWPIDTEAGNLPEGWTGWPDGKKFALVLSHDVDTAKGHDRCRLLMDLEERSGFRSTFNFVPEGYEVSAELRHEIKSRGFDVAIHGLKHDGWLFSSRRIFEKRLPEINRYIAEWGASGFHSPAMYHNLEWSTEFDIEYDCSTFDTDPFEPQPDGVKTIFPFWVESRRSQRGYVELPYTLPQDHLVFVILQKKDLTIWREKLAWIAERGGMALLNSHPDYMNFHKGPCAREQYPASQYAAFLEHIKQEYEGLYWQAPPRDVAQFWREWMRSR